MNWYKSRWLKGLISAAIGGAANSITVMAIDPMQFNLGTGFKKLGTVAVISAVVSVAMYLKQSPLPETVTVVEREVIYEEDDRR